MLPQDAGLASQTCEEVVLRFAIFLSIGLYLSASSSGREFAFPSLGFEDLEKQRLHEEQYWVWSNGLDGTYGGGREDGNDGKFAMFPRGLDYDGDVHGVDNVLGGADCDDGTGQHGG